MLLASGASLGQTAVMLMLLPELPWPLVAASAAVAGLFFPVLNASVVTVRTMRTPVSLRPTVHTAAVTVAMILAPIGALAAGPALETFDLAAVLAAILVGNTVCGLAITAAGLRERALVRPDAAPASAGPGGPRGP